MRASAPAWVLAALTETDGPSGIVEALVGSKVLAPLWGRLSAAQRAHIWSLPLHIGVTIQAKQLPWPENWTEAEQLHQAEIVAKLARDLNKALAEFGPLAPVGLQRFFPRDDHNEQLFLASLPPVASTDPRLPPGLLQLIAEAAEKFRPTLPRRVKRPMRRDAYQTYFVRSLASRFDGPVGDQFLAELVNMFAGGEWDSERVRKSLASSRKSKST